MGTRGKNQKDIDLIGSVTAEVIDRSRTAVLAIPENTPFKQFSEVKRIAFITNFDQRDKDKRGNERSRTLIFISTALLTGTVTAFCGPVGFIGLAIGVTSCVGH